MKNKNIIYKIGILINWTREIDFYLNFVQHLQDEKYIFIINDIKTLEKERENNSNLIKHKLEELKLDYVFFSKVYGKYKYSILISTGLSQAKKISIYSIFKFLYARTFGCFFEYIKLDLFNKSIFNKPLTGGGSKSTIYVESFPEKKIGIKLVFFPRGLDLRLKHFPNNKFKNVFDIFLCHGKFDKELIEKKFKISNNIFIIGYPKYDLKLDINNIKKKLDVEFGLDYKKKTIFWCPTYIEETHETSKNIELWLEKINLLTKKYNILIRPHPKNLVVDRKLLNRLEHYQLKIDKESHRRLLELYTISDLVLLDYGSSVLSSIYLKKKIALLELPEKFKYLDRLQSTNTIDFEIRKEIDPKILIKLNNNLFFKQIDDLVNNTDQEFLRVLRNKYFGDGNDIVALKEIAEKLNKFLLKN